MEEEKGCIYYIFCKETNKGYVGQHCKPIPDERIKAHFRSKEKFMLQNAMRKYGKDAFTVTTLCVVPISSLPNMEAYWAEQLETYKWDFPGGYNMVWCGQPPTIGMSLSMETRQKISISLRKPDANLKLRLTHLGKKKSQECIQKMKLRTMSEESRQKLRQKKIGTHATIETRQKLSAKKKGVPKSEITKQRMAEARRKYWERKRQEHEKESS